jgi:hypothetical protein
MILEFLDRETALKMFLVSKDFNKLVKAFMEHKRAVAPVIIKQTMSFRQKARKRRQALKKRATADTVDATMIALALFKL